MYAALVLERLAEAGEDEKFTDDPVTHAYRKLLEVERNKDVRKCVLGAMVIVAGTTVVVRSLPQLDDLILAEHLGLVASGPLGMLGRLFTGYARKARAVA